MGVSQAENHWHSLLHDAVINGDESFALKLLSLTIKSHKWSGGDDKIKIGGNVRKVSLSLSLYSSTALLHHVIYAGMYKLLQALIKPPFSLNTQAPATGAPPLPPLLGNAVHMAIMRNRINCLAVIINQAVYDNHSSNGNMNKNRL